MNGLCFRGEDEARRREWLSSPSGCCTAFSGLCIPPAKEEKQALWAAWKAGWPTHRRATARFCHLATSGADTELRVVRLDLLVLDVVGGNLLLQICQGGAKLLRVDLFLSTHTRVKTWVNESINQSVNQSIDQSINQPFNQSKFICLAHIIHQNVAQGQAPWATFKNKKDKKQHSTEVLQAIKTHLLLQNTHRLSSPHYTQTHTHRWGMSGVLKMTDEAGKQSDGCGSKWEVARRFPEHPLWFRSHLLVVENRRPVDFRHHGNVINLLVDFPVEAAVLQPAVVQVDDAGWGGQTGKGWVFFWHEQS